MAHLLAAGVKKKPTKKKEEESSEEDEELEKRKVSELNNIKLCFLKAAGEVKRCCMFQNATNKPLCSTIHNAGVNCSNSAIFLVAVPRCRSNDG